MKPLSALLISMSQFRKMKTCLKFTLLVPCFFLNGLSLVNGQSSSDSLVLFVGKKIHATFLKGEGMVEKTSGSPLSFSIVTTYDPDKFKVRYQILKLVSGEYKFDTMSLTIPIKDGSSIDETIIDTALIVAEYFEGNLYLVRGRYCRAFETKDRNWAVPVEPGDIENQTFAEIKRPIMPSFVNYKVKPRYSLKGMKDEEILRKYPEPHYKVSASVAETIYGFYVKDLFMVRLYPMFLLNGTFDLY